MNLMRGSVFEDYLVKTTFEAYFVKVGPHQDYEEVKLKIKNGEDIGRSPGELEILR